MGRERGYADQLLRDLSCSTTKVYMASSLFTFDTAATDVFVITGVANKTVTLIHASISGIQTTPGSVVARLVKRSSANTGGTSTTITGVPLASTSVAAGATVKAYTANPTTGTQVGILQVDYLYLPDISGNRSSDSNGFINLDSVPVGWLLSDSESIAINLNGSTAAGNSIACHFVWMET